MLRPSAVESRFEALRCGADAARRPRGGDRAAAPTLASRRKRAKARWSSLSGEPGIGKSRLRAALQERLQGEPHVGLRYFCSPHHADSALYPIIAQLERAAGFEREDTPEAQLEKLEALLAPARATAGGRAASGRPAVAARRRPLPAAKLSARSSKKERRWRRCCGQLEGLARRRPVLMIFEDAHWIDPTSLELLELHRRRVANLPCC